MNEETLKQLTALRDKLRQTEKTEAGNPAKICTDKALESLAVYEPRSLEEMRTLDNVSDEFVDKYGKQFLEVINKNRVKNDSSMKSIKMTERQSSVLKELEKNLVDINRKNKMLYIPKSIAKHSQDLYSTHYDIRDLIFGKVKSITICDRAEGEGKKYTGFQTVMREAARDLREKGKNDLYIGYPFIKGKLQGEGFEVRCPLAIIPVKAEKTPDTIKLTLDRDRDTLFNIVLILAHQKFNNIRNKLPDMEFEEYTQETFFPQLMRYYSDQGIRILCGGYETLEPFEDYKADEFPKYGPGELHWENVAALGKFSIHASAISKDYDEMIGSNEINDRLNNLIDAYDLSAYDDKFYGDSDFTERRPAEVLEKEIVYINDLNGSQERVLKTLETTDELVIQGPPGTGKSQTIASLIVDSVNKGKTVLMVSEKKTALDVVYSRLGILSRYAIQIDDIGDKETFYKQMDDIVNIKAESENPVDLMEISAQIDGEVKRLDELARTLYTPNEFGIEPYQLFHCAERIDPNDEVQYQLYRMLPSVPEVTRINFIELQRSHEYFRNEDSVRALCAYRSFVDSDPILSSFSKNLGTFDLRALKEDADRISNDVNAWKGKFFLSKIFSKGKVSAEVDEFVSKYLASGNRAQLTNMLMNSGFDQVKRGADKYDSFILTDAAYTAAGASEKIYLDSFIKAKEICPTDANDQLYKQLVSWHIDDFRKNHKQVFATIEDFNAIVARIEELTKKKKELSIKHTEQILQKDLNKNILDISKKGCKELLRKVDSKRKKSVNLFVKMFSGQLFNGIRIWLMTPEVVSEIIPLEKGRFDMVIFDEASQMYREKGLPAIYRAKKVVIAGDDKQLRPSSVGKGRFDAVFEEDEEDLDAAIEELSLLDLAKSRYTPVLLDYHYRSRYEELINFSNYAFYRAKLYVSPNVAQPKEPPIKMHIVHGVWADRSNKKEAQKVVELIKEFFERRKEKETIGVITFNINQRDLIERMIEEECAKDHTFAVRYEKESNRKENGEDVGLFIRSIENVQGDERDEIIFSVAYAKDSDGRFRRNFGTLNQEGGENRLNVAITRAKKKVQIVTSMKPNEFDVSGIAARGPFFLQKYLEYSYAISEGNNELAKSILLSFHDDVSPGSTVRFDSGFEEEVYDALKDQGLNVETQIGVGGYSIDLAIKKYGKYVLGIECDGKLYHSSQSARERDYHRQKYLESRGWRIHRIWSTNWWNDKSMEVNKIVEIVKTL